MKSIETMKQETGLNNLEMLLCLKEVCSYYLCDDDLEPFLVKWAENKLNCCNSK